MGRDDVLARYRPLRAAIQRVLKEAPKTCRATEWRRALSDIAPWADEAQLEGEVLDMAADVALFEPDKRGRRAFDRFIKGDGRHLPAADQDLARDMARAWFSLFRVAERHEAAGMWLEDLLQGERRIWLMDEGLEASATPNLILGLRVFDAGPFHAAFGLITQPDDLTLGSCLAAHARRQPLRESSSLAAMLYADHLAAEAPLGDEELDILQEFVDLLDSDPGVLIEHDQGSRKAKPAIAAPKRKKR